MEQITLDSFTTSDKPEGKPSVADIRFTGDPFVDMGRLVMDTLRQKTVEEKIRFVTDVYVDRWKGKIHPVFLNSKITIGHVVSKPEAQRKDSLEYYFGLLKEKKSVSKGYCRICASKGTLFEGGCHNYPMVGADYTDRIIGKVYVGRRMGFMDELEDSLKAYRDENQKIFYGSVNEAVKAYLEEVKTQVP